MQFFRVKNFYKYQGDRRRDAERNETWAAKWVKIHHIILESFEFAKLTAGERFIFIGLILLASEYRNVVRADPEYLQFRLHLDEPVNLDSFLELNFIEESDGNSIIDEEKPKKKWTKRQITAQWSVITFTLGQFADRPNDARERVESNLDPVAMAVLDDMGGLEAVERLGLEEAEKEFFSGMTGND